ncbi:MAG: FAD-dependent oxidoreductase [Burkholderiaceae bacterium]|nr:FAD-dependent oxidoreductase [Burkholderiaceae bacterium]
MSHRLKTHASQMTTRSKFVPASNHTVARRVLVIGGGICGSTTAAVLAQAGLDVTLFDPGSTHDGHLAAALTPVISGDDNARSRLSRLGAIEADRFWRSLRAQTGIEFGLPCGALQLQRPDGAKRAQDLKAQSLAFNQPDWARWVDRDQASRLAGIELPRGGIWYPGGWLIQVPKLIQALRSISGVHVVPHAVSCVEQTGQGWLARGEHDQILGQGDAVVLANAFDVLDLLERSGFEQSIAACKRLPALHRLAGEVTLLPAHALVGGPQCVVGGDGYVLPAVGGWCVSGGTYVRGAETAKCTEAGKRANIDRVSELLGMSFELGEDGHLPGWAGWRAVLPGRCLPSVRSSHCPTFGSLLPMRHVG